MASKELDNIIIENARIGFKNFSGKIGKFNPEGNRNFCVFLDEDIANKLKKDGWNVKYLKPREEGDKEQAYLQVKVRFENRPPNVVIKSSRGKSRIDESEVNMLDWAEIENVDLNISPYVYDFNGNKGVSAYLKSMFVTIEEDPLEMKYVNTPDSAENAIGGCGSCQVCEGNCGDCDGD